MKVFVDLRISRVSAFAFPAVDFKTVEALQQGNKLVRTFTLHGGGESGDCRQLIVGEFPIGNSIFRVPGVRRIVQNLSGGTMGEGNISLGSFLQVKVPSLSCIAPRCASTLAAAGCKLPILLLAIAATSRLGYTGFLFGLKTALSLICNLS